YWIQFYMFNFRRISTLTTGAFLALSLLTGCSSNEKVAVTETAENFLSIVAEGTTENIEQYANNEVTEGSFVKTFDSGYLAEEFREGFVTEDVDEETLAKVNDFCSTISNMITGYEISDVTVNKDGTGTVIAIINTAFPIDIIDSDEALAKILQVADTYYAENEETIAAMYEEKTQEEVEAYIYNDMIDQTINLYTEMIDNAEEESYAIVLTLKKNTETDSWYVSAVSSYDNATSGTTEAATETATTASSNTSTEASSELSSELSEKSSTDTSSESSSN
ncbi:MAG: hypothetical protein K5792_12375, partial [Butyrivibrio sp.]|nr:hypothetical protein [Butyrivibrio sp.]